MQLLVGLVTPVRGDERQRRKARLGHASWVLQELTGAVPDRIREIRLLKKLGQDFLRFSRPVQAKEGLGQRQPALLGWYLGRSQQISEGRFGGAQSLAVLPNGPLFGGGQDAPQEEGGLGPQLHVVFRQLEGTMKDRLVYRASHAMLRRPTAIKLLPAEKAGEQSIARFEREVQLTAGLSHPNTVTIFDFGRTPDGVFYYAMEFLDGAGLDVVVGHAGALPPERILHVLDGVAGALTEAHEAGLVHRDIKPANIILCKQGGAFDVPKVVDFGLVKDVTAESSLTVTATLTGTPLYKIGRASCRERVCQYV